MKYNLFEYLYLFPDITRKRQFTVVSVIRIKKYLRNMNHNLNEYCALLTLIKAIVHQDFKMIEEN